MKNKRVNKNPRPTIFVGGYLHKDLADHVHKRAAAEYKHISAILTELVLKDLKEKSTKETK
jgi:hypothetical protein